MRTLKIIFLSLVITFTQSCTSDDDETINQDDVLKISDLSGSWKADSSIFTNNADGSESFDLVANDGEIRYTMFVDGRVRTWIVLGEFNDEWDALASLNGQILTVTPVESSRSVQKSTVVKNGNTITLTNKNDVFDFTLNGDSPTSATSVTIFKPNK